MKRKIGSVISGIALLAIAAGAAAVNVKILHGNQATTSVLNVQEAADVTSLADPTPAATERAVAVEPTPAPAQADAATVESTAPSAPAAPTPLPLRASQGNGQGKMAIGRVAGGDDDDENGEHRERGGQGEHHERRGFVPLSPEQMALLRVAALAQVSPAQARDAANGIGSSTVINRVKSAASQIGVRLSDLAAVTDLPPERGRGHGGDDDDHEGDDDD